VLATPTSRLTAGVAAACVAVMAATWFLLIAPRRADAESFRAQQVSAAQANAELRTKVAELRAQAANLPKTKQELARLRTQLTPTADLAVLVRTVSSLATTAGVNLRSIKPGVPTALDQKNAAGHGVVAVPISLETSGDYFQTVAFVRKLQVDMTRVMLLRNIKIDAVDATAGSQTTGVGQVKLALDGQVFVLADGATAGAATAGAAPGAPATKPGTSSSSNAVSQ
jgi:Tfp pilus assembly protein PilO